MLFKYRSGTAYLYKSLLETIKITTPAIKIVKPERVLVAIILVYLNFLWLFFLSILNQKTILG
jgi:hypothetical protein